MTSDTHWSCRSAHPQPDLSHFHESLLIWTLLALFLWLQGSRCLSLRVHRSSLTDAHSCCWKAQANVRLLQMPLHALPRKQFKWRSILRWSTEESWVISRRRNVNPPFTLKRHMCRNCCVGLMVTKMMCVVSFFFEFFYLRHYKGLQKTSLLKPFVFMLCKCCTQSLKAKSMATEGHLTFQLTTLLWGWKQQSLFLKGKIIDLLGWISQALTRIWNRQFHFKFEKATKNFSCTTITNKINTLIWTHT